MKTLTLRNIPEDVQAIIKEEKLWQTPLTSTIYRLIRKVPRLEAQISELKALINDSN